MVIALAQARLGEMPSLPLCIYVLQREMGLEPSGGGRPATSCLEGAGYAASYLAARQVKPSPSDDVPLYLGGPRPDRVLHN